MAFSNGQLNRHKTSIHLVPSVCLNFRQAIYKDKKNQTSNQFNVEVAEGTGSKFSMYFKRDNLRMIPGEYDLIVSSKNISHWINANKNLQYWIALEVDSTFEG